MNKWLMIGLGVAVFVGFLTWLFLSSEEKVPGQQFTSEGRDHIEIGTPVEYKTNPPTSGKHYADWTRAGVYDTPRDDRNLVHSLEHGYVIISYNCDKQLPITNYQLPINAYAHGIEEEATSSGEATDSGQLSSAFRSEDCHKLVDQLISIYEKKGKTRLVVVPRPNLDSRIALTAWQYLDKFDNFDEPRIVEFIDAHLNMGPEKTMETPGK